MRSGHPNPLTSARTVSAHAGYRLLLCLSLLLIFVALVPGEALGNGTNIHELANSHPTIPSYEPTLPSETFGGCGRARYPDPRTRKCRGPADFGNWKFIVQRCRVKTVCEIAQKKHLPAHDRR